MSSNLAFKIQVSMRRSLDDGPVFKKQDGGRFSNSVTVKVNAGTKYSIFVTTRPARAVRQIQVKSVKLNIVREKPQRHDENCLVYHADWSTVGFDVSKSGSRIDLPIVIELEDGACAETKLQIKIYPEAETTHSKWGQELHMLDLDCTCKSGQSVVSVQREEYF